MIVQFLHLSSYGILFGAQVFQTFINGIVAFKALGRPYFGVHQAAIFPVYFSLQSFLPVLVGLTSTTSLENGLNWKSGRVMGAVTVTGLINLVVFRPLTQGAVRAKNAQELRDKRRGGDGPSKELVARNSRFMVIHASSILINVIGLLATVHYGIGLGMRLS
ncbi:uncharacterized protein N7498_004220 [Penicillium cinerascens]|uniref:TMEM205-like domain-containing protein n=1 Tax=Penicillium cinerascens TaxID=70096 RepID=A0A9W9N4E9_9EURO|nr:uncharacterized protein N7498_004220 [Penicillium cinerascens]KAJ5212574.1 hypothetical protein N7498_004220 [Penicillium cinerascens]